MLIFCTGDVQLGGNGGTRFSGSLRAKDFLFLHSPTRDIRGEGHKAKVRTGTKRQSIALGRVRVYRTSKRRISIIHVSISQCNTEKMGNE